MLLIAINWFGCGKTDEKDAQECLKKIEGMIGQKLDDYEKQVMDKYDEDMNRLMNYLDPPAGTVMAFAGDATKVPNGWLLCDGKPYDGGDDRYKRLYAVIGEIYGNRTHKVGWFDVPDYRGVFLRGVDDPDGSEGLEAARKDPDSTIRENMDGTSGGLVGSAQGWAIRMPDKGINIDGGSHGHPVYVRGGNDPQSKHVISEGYIGGGEHSTEVITEGGEHNHTITGGDNETRPVNVYVNWIIKI